MMALIAGLAIPLVIIWLKDFLNNKVNTKSDITDTLRSPVLGEIGHNLTSEVLVVKPASRKVIGEQFRNLRSNINFLIPGLKKFVVLVTSSNAGEGKSFVCINLAATYAVAGKKTVLIELDLRKPKLGKYLNITTDSGLTDYLINNKPLPSIIKNIPDYDNMKVILAGPIPPNPSELLLHKKMEELVEELKKEFDVIVFDCPPVGLVSDAQIISPYADLSIFVIRQRVTLKTQLTFIDEVYENNRLKNMSIIVNDVRSSDYYGHYGYGNYGYGAYGYSVDTNGSKNGDGYFEDEGEKKNWFVRNLLRK
jgi:capsular exopolysaccharide synthesis family protein